MSLYTTIVLNKSLEEGSFVIDVLLKEIQRQGRLMPLRTCNRCKEDFEAKDYLFTCPKCKRRDRDKKNRYLKKCKSQNQQTTPAHFFNDWLLEDIT